MIGVNEFKELVFAQVNKESGGFKPTPAQFNAFMKAALRETYNYLYGLLGEYQKGSRSARVSTEASRMISEAERYLHADKMLPIVNGRISIPDGQSVLAADGSVCPKFRHRKRILVRYVIGTEENWNEARVVENDDASFENDSLINYPTAKRPIAELESDKFLIRTGDYPAQFARLVYQREPAEPVWGFTVDDALPQNRQRPVYDPNTSVDIDLPDIMFDYMKERTIALMSLRERDVEMYRASDQRSKTIQ